MFISSRIAPLLELGFFKVEPKSYCVALNTFVLLVLLCTNTYWKINQHRTNLNFSFSM